MRIGYPCINRSVKCRGNRTFRLKSYSDERLKTTIVHNLECLQRMLEYNAAHGIGFFRITSDLVPFASHPVCVFPWQKVFREQFFGIGEYVRHNGMRVSMHPDQFTLINSPRDEVFRRSVLELDYHAQVLDLMGMDLTAKIQIHVGGVYGEKRQARKRFIKRYGLLKEQIRRRLAVENDDKSYHSRDCLEIHEHTGIPVIIDTLHHQINPDMDTLPVVLRKAAATWMNVDGLPVVDYSSQEPGAVPGKHAESLNIGDFALFLEKTRPLDIDIMLEIKDKEISALKALKTAQSDPRLAGI